MTAQAMLPFSGTIHGQTTTDRTEWPALVKGAGPLTEPFNCGGKPAKRRMAFIPDTPVHRGRIFAKPRVYLTAAEREWLGASVTVKLPHPCAVHTVNRCTICPRAVWQVWALAPTYGYVWIVRNGRSRQARTEDLVRVVPDVEDPDGAAG
jgi:hypothetical protein